MSRSKEKCDAAIAEILSYPDRIDWGEGFSVPGDVTDGAAMAACVAAAEEQMGGPLDARVAACPSSAGVSSTSVATSTRTAPITHHTPRA